MQNRFGFRDLILSLLLVAIIILLSLSLHQQNRHWQQQVDAETRLRDDIANLDQRFEQLLDELYEDVPPEPSTGAGADFEQEADNGETDAVDDQTDGRDAQEPHAPYGDGEGDDTVFVAADGEDAPAQRRLRRPNLGPRPEARFGEGHAFHRRVQIQRQEDYAAGDWVVDVLHSSIGKLTPIVPADAYQSRIEPYVIESLAQRSPETLDWEPVIARSWTQSDDGLELHFKLRDDVTFSDGEPLTSEDVVWTFRWIMNDRVNAPQLRSYYNRFESVEAKGPHEVVFRLREPYFRAMDFAAGMPILAEHWYGQFSPEEFNRLPGLLFGSGPYRLQGDPRTWRPGGNTITLERNQRYWGPRPPFDRLMWRIVMSPAGRAADYRQGRIDIFTPEPEEHGQHKRNPRMRERGPIFEFFSPTAGYRYIGWNQRRDGEDTRFADPKVRRAMTMLTNRELICERIMHGLAKPTSGPFNIQSPQYNADIDPWPYDLEKARELLREAGYKDRNGDGVIQNEDGEDFRFRLIYPSRNPNYHEMALYLRDSYMRAGIILEPDPTEWTTMLQRIDERNFEAITLGWTASLEGDPYQIFHSSQIADGGHNFINYRNEELDEVIEKGRTEMNEDKRMAHWHEVHRILHEDQPYTFLFNQISVRYVDGRFSNVRQLELELTPRIEWYVPHHQQRY